MIFKGIFFRFENVVFLMMFLKLIYFRVETNFPVLDSVVFMANLGLLILCAAIIRLFTGNIRYIMLIISDLLLTLILFSDLIYFRYFSDVISIPVILQAKQLNFVKDSILQLINKKDILLLIDFPVILFLVKKLPAKALENSNRFRERLVPFVALLVLGSISFNYALFTVKKANPHLLESLWSRKEVVHIIGLLPFHIIDTKDFFEANYSSEMTIGLDDKKVIQKWFSSHNNTKSKNLMNGLAKDKNIIVIQVEALADFVIDRKVNGEEITPNLNRLAQGGVYFNNFYSQVYGGNTSDAEFMTNVSLYPIKRGAAFYRYSFNDYDSIAKIISKQGYKSYAFHAYQPHFWNREIMYNTFGYEKLYAERDYKIDDIVGPGLGDKSFLRQSFEKIKNLDEPVYLSLITLSSHYPFNFDGYGDLNIQGYDGTILGNYFKAINYTDQAIGNFISLLSESGILEKSVLIIYGDHSAIAPNEVQLVYDFLDWEDKGAPTLIQTKKVPLIIKFPNEVVKGINQTLGGQVDLKPTILNLLGIQKHMSMGQDLFNKTNDIVIFPNAQFIEGNKLYSGGEAYDLKTGNKIADNNYQIKTQICQGTLAISRKIVRNNYSIDSGGSVFKMVRN